MSSSASTDQATDIALQLDERRLHILRIAAQTFSEMGFQRATLDDVAARLGVTKPALYYYFKSKDEMLSLCGRMAVQQAIAGTEVLDSEKLTGSENLWRFFSQWTEVICDDFGRCLVQTLPRDLAEKTRESNIRARRNLESTVRDFLVQGIADGSIRECDPAITTKFLFDAFNGISRWFSHDGSLSAQEVARHYIDLLAPGLCIHETNPNSR